MNVVSIGSNCFYGMLTKYYMKSINQINTYYKTSFLSKGIISRNNNNDVSQLELVYNLLFKIKNNDYSFIKNSESRKCKNDPMSDVVNYYINSIKSGPIFFRHTIDEEDQYDIININQHLNSVINRSQYFTTPIDIIIYGSEFIINNTDIDWIINIYNLFNNNLIIPKMIVLNKNINYINKNINIINIGNKIYECKWKDEYTKQYSLTTATYNLLCNIFGFNLDKNIFLR